MQLNHFRVSGITGVIPLTARSASMAKRQPLVPLLYTGIEIEGESVSCSNDDFDNLREAGWAWHEDGSLRDGGLEFTLSRPLFGSDLSNAIEVMFAQTREGDLEFYSSPRAGTHVHINMSDRTWGDVQAFFALVYCLDSLIFRFAGEDRKWCSYCNSLNTLPASVIQRLLSTKEVASAYWHELWTMRDSERYYGFNVAALAKYGTVELRYFPTATSEEQLWSWVDLAHQLYIEALAMADPNNPTEAVLSALESNAAGVISKFPMLAPLLDEQGMSDVMEAVEELRAVMLATPFSEDDPSYYVNAQQEAAPDMPAVSRPFVDVYAQPLPDYFLNGGAR